MFLFLSLFRLCTLDCLPTEDKTLVSFLAPFFTCVFIFWFFCINRHCDKFMASFDKPVAILAVLYRTFLTYGYSSIFFVNLFARRQINMIDWLIKDVMYWICLISNLFILRLEFRASGCWFKNIDWRLLLQGVDCDSSETVTCKHCVIVTHCIMKKTNSHWFLFQIFEFAYDYVYTYIRNYALIYLCIGIQP